MTFVEELKSPELKPWWPWIWSSLPVIVLLQYQAVAPVGHWSLLFLELPYAFGILAAAIGLVVLPLLAIRRAKRMLMLAWWIAAVVYLPLVVGGILIGEQIRQGGFDRLALRSAPLVAAINAYAKTHGQPPASLNDLVPDYLSKVPRTGMMAYPDYVYHVGEAAQRYDKNPWVLVIQTPSGFPNFDKFIYFPLQNYPERGYGGSLQRIRDWAYVHE